MRRIFFFFIILLICHSCRNEIKTGIDKDINTRIDNDGLKEIGDYYTTLIQERVEKAVALLGPPDEMKTSPNGANGYYIYYDRVKDNGRIKHLVIFNHFNDNTDAFRVITHVEAASDGETVRAVVIKKPLDNRKKPVKSTTATAPTFNKFYLSLLGGRSMYPFNFIYFLDDNTCIKDGEKATYWYDKERKIIKFTSDFKVEYYEALPPNSILSNFDYRLRRDYNIDLKLQSSDMVFFEANVYIDVNGEERLESQSHTNYAYVYTDKSPELNRLLKDELNKAIKEDEYSMAFFDNVIEGVEKVISEIRELNESSLSQIIQSNNEYDYKRHVEILNKIKNEKEKINRYIQDAKQISDVYESNILFTYKKTVSRLKSLRKQASDEYNILKYEIYPYYMNNLK